MVFGSLTPRSASLHVGLPICRPFHGLRSLLALSVGYLTQQIPKFAGREYGKGRFRCDGEEAGIAGYEDVGMAVNGRGKNSAVGGVTDGEAVRGQWFWDYFDSVEDGFDSGDRFVGQTKLLRQGTSQFVEMHCSSDQFVFGQTDAKHVRTQPACGKRRHEDIGIKTDSHELPLASASG